MNAGSNPDEMHISFIKDSQKTNAANQKLINIMYIVIIYITANPFLLKYIDIIEKRDRERMSLVTGINTVWLKEKVWS